MAATTVGQRFSLLIKELGLTKNAFAQSLGKTATVIQHLVDERNKPGYDLLCKVFEVYPNVSKDWLLLGQGGILLSERIGGGAASKASARPAAPTLTPAAPADETNAPAEGAATPTPPIQALIPAAAKAAAPQAPAEAPTVGVATPAVATASPVSVEAYVAAALHTQHLQHQLALAEQRNQHLLEQQQLLQQMLELHRSRSN